MSETKKQSSFVADAIRLMFITLIAGLLLEEGERFAPHRSGS